MPAIAREKLWELLKNEQEASHHVQRTWIAAHHLPGEVNPTRDFTLIVKFSHASNLRTRCMSSEVVCCLDVSLQGKGAEGVVWKFAAEVRAQPHRAGQEKWQAEVRPACNVSLEAFRWTRSGNLFQWCFFSPPCFYRLHDEVNEPLKWKESFDNLLSSQSKSTILCRCDGITLSINFSQRAFNVRFASVSRRTVSVQSVPGVRVQRGEHRLLLGLWGLPDEQTAQAGRQGQEDLQGVCLLRRATRGTAHPQPSLRSAGPTNLPTRRWL